MSRGTRIRDATKLSQLSPETFSTMQPATTNIRLLYRHRVREWAGLEESKARVELVARERGLIPEEIVAGQSALVREKIAASKSRRPRGLQRKVGKVPAHGSVEPESAPVREERDRRSRERLGARAEREKRVGRDREVLLHVAVTKAACEAQVSLLDHSHGHARNLVTRHQTANEGREIVRKPLCQCSRRGPAPSGPSHEDRCRGWL